MTFEFFFKVDHLAKKKKKKKRKEYLKRNRYFGHLGIYAFLNVLQKVQITSYIKIRDIRIYDEKWVSSPENLTLLYANNKGTYLAPRLYNFSCSTQLSMKLILFINVKMPPIVGILSFISRVDTTSECFQARTSCILRLFSFMGTLGSGYKQITAHKPVQGGLEFP